MLPSAHPHPKRHLNRLRRFCKAHNCDRQTDRPRYSVGNNRAHLSTVVWRNNAGRLSLDIVTMVANRQPIYLHLTAVFQVNQGYVVPLGVHPSLVLEEKLWTQVAQQVRCQMAFVSPNQQRQSHSLANCDSCPTPAKSEAIEYLQVGPTEIRYSIA